MSNIFVERAAALKRHRTDKVYSDAYFDMLQNTVDGSKMRTVVCA